MQCSSPESFRSTEQCHDIEEHRSALRTTLSKIALYNFAAAHQLDTPIELTGRLILCVLLANDGRPLSRTELHQITMVNPLTIDSALINLGQHDEVRALSRDPSEQTVHVLTELGQATALSSESWTTSFYHFADYGSDAGVQDLLAQLQQRIRRLVTVKAIPILRTCIACEFFLPAARNHSHLPSGHCHLLNIPLTVHITPAATAGNQAP
ncbi:MAG: hypothetical protein H8K06_13370 [Nitrospira sp.]|jgi:hypothetical protein|nr:hypothetical protein [Nitrospira sp.]